MKGKRLVLRHGFATNAPIRVPMVEKRLIETSDPRSR